MSVTPELVTLSGAEDAPVAAWVKHNTNASSFADAINALQTAVEALQGSVSGLAESFIEWDAEAGHDHDGTTSRAVNHANLLNKGENTHDALDDFVASKGQPGGIMGLDENGKAPLSQLPASAITTPFPVADQAAMLALDAQPGDVAVVASEGKSYILQGEDPSILANWLWLESPSAAGGVASVDGRTGTVDLSDRYAAIGKGVTNGDSHDHNGGDGAQVAHGSLGDKGTNTHAQIDTALAASTSHIAAAAPHSGHEVMTAKGAAGGYPSLNASQQVDQNPANATATATASKIPIADGAGKLDTWVSDAGASTNGKIRLAGQLGGTAASPTVTGITETGGPTALAFGAIADGQAIKRSGSTAIGFDIYDDITVTISGGGSAITTGAKCWLQVNFACTITAWTILPDQSGSIVIDIWKDSYANFPPVDADSICASALPTLTSTTKATSTTLTGWTTSISAGDVLKFNVDSCSTCTSVTLTLKVKRTL